PSAPAAKADAADRKPWPRTLDKTPLAGGPEPDSWSDIGKGAQGDDALDRHRQMREEMERPIKMNIEGSRMRRTSFSSRPINRANADLLKPRSRMASSSANFAAISGSTAIDTSFAP